MGWALSIAYRAVTLSGAVLAFAPPTASAQDTQTRLQLPPLSHTAVGFDAARGRLVVYGGLVPGNPELLQGTWEWDGNRWRQVADSASSPPRRDGATMAYDPDTRQGQWFQSRPRNLMVRDNSGTLSQLMEATVMLPRPPLPRSRQPRPPRSA